ncbi:MAG: hypothetical protein KGJ23_10065 [Euryarchaeota archaeon]|nr:hypothetical protein [Euryarchaeota archaeon]MDE1836949.1 hypothetical protein [Euryarchaeota archaeon]MDE1882061.1 hypothetical protein [Euryarchaeota archaeon]MDE2045866.1 hypothetical protein [Thermoplasmata archaeon]
MREKREVEAILLAEQDATRRLLTFCALLSSDTGLSEDAVLVVGGSAIELYTRGAYVSGDVDLVVPDKDRIASSLRRWGFGKEGRLWVRDDWKLAVDLVGTYYTGSSTRTRIITTPYGPVRLAAIEDLLVKRLASAKHWRQRGDLEHAALLGARFKDSIDWTYARERAKTFDVADLLRALEREIMPGAREERTKGRPPG